MKRWIFFFQKLGGFISLKIWSLKLFVVIPPKIDCTKELIALEKVFYDSTIGMIGIL